MMMTQQVQLAQQMPASLGGGVGAILTLSQNPCLANPGVCCNSKNTTCANWAGAHLVSAGCIQYGILELEAAFAMYVRRTRTHARMRRAVLAARVPDATLSWRVQARQCRRGP